MNMNKLRAIGCWNSICEPVRFRSLVFLTTELT